MRGSRAPSLPWSTWAIITAAGLGGAAVLAWAAVWLAGWQPTGRQVLVVSVFGLLWAANWVYPLVVYRGEQSEAMHFDVAFFVVLAVLVPGAPIVVAVGAATVLSQLWKRRPLSKAIFNVGQMLVSTAAAIAVFDLLAHPSLHVSDQAVMAALVAAAVWFAVNALCVTLVLASNGAVWRTVLLDGLDLRLMLDGCGVVIAVPIALAVSSSVWGVAFAVLPLIVFRQVLAGHFEARHDHARMRGLFEATLDINATMGIDETRGAILASARDLLRCSDAELGDADPLHGDMRAVLAVADDPLTLSVSGRSRTEPFHTADQALLDALAAVGATALTNAELYQQGKIQRDRLSAITNSLGEGVCAVNRAGQVTFANPAAAEMLGWQRIDDLSHHQLEAGLDFGFRAPQFIAAPAMRAMAKVDTITNYDTRFVRIDGSMFHVTFTVSPIVTDGLVKGAVLVFRDITERKQFEEELARHAFHDALTGLPNRRLFLDHLDHALRRSERSDEQHAVLFADVDRFKIINDSLGHHAGDQLLIAISNKIRSAVRPGDMLARFGGDEFTLLVEGVGSPEDSVACAQRILDRMREPITLPDGHEVVATVSIGIALTAQDKSRDDVLHDADVAMYQAKAKGRGGHFEVFDVSAMGVRSADRIDLEAGLRRGLDRDELVVYYQPVCELTTGDVVGAEALVRWRHPERGLLAPAEFIGLAEDTGLILPLGKEVLVQACQQARAWKQQFGVSLSIAVNLSARQFQQANLVEDIESVLRTTGVDPSQISLEITESLAMEDAEQTSLVLTRLKGLGVKVAIDDFGTGYSALGYLATFPVDVVKVDRSFVDKVDMDPVKSAIVSAVINLSRAIGTTTVVEGIETKEELEHLKMLGCTMAQGYYFARPMPVDDMTDLLARSLGGRPAQRSERRTAKRAG